ncbi:MAG: FAD-binding protein [Rubrivivax sp.]|nr:FAD-binding protein [Rubrivivax sp.]
MTAAAVAAAEGLRVLLVEASPLVGGTTAVSGGMVWLPANHRMAEAGIADSLDAARRYLGQVVPPGGDGTMLETFLARGDEALRYLEARTALRLRPVLRYPDYYPALDGATAGGRVLEPVPFDGRALGAAFARLRAPLPEFTLFGGMMIDRADIPHLRRAARSPASAWRVAKLLLRHARERLRAARGTTLVLGNALAARLYRSLLDLGVELRTGTAVERLLQDDDGRVSGVELRDGGTRACVFARRGVVLASGGLSHDAALRPRFVPALAGTLTATVGSAQVASGARLAQTVGAALSRSSQQQAFWVPASVVPRADGSTGVFPHTVTDRGKPGLIAVDQSGRRFVNEALSYHEFVRGQLRRGAQAVPAWLVCDRRFLWRYGLGAVRPFTLLPGRHVASGYLTSAGTLPALAQRLGLPAQDFAETIAVWNTDARRGLDTRFGRGGDIYQRHLGDADHGPNPCVAPIETPPFYAVAVQPADLGMAAGLVTDADARVLRADGTPVPGLYACGNDMQSVMNGAYPGPGITLGPALVFGYVAARHAAAASPVAAVP